VGEAPRGLIVARVTGGRRILYRLVDTLAEEPIMVESEGDEVTISEQLKQAMRGYGSIYAVARDSGLSQTSLNRFIRGERGLSQEAIDRLGEFFGMHLTRPTRPRPPKAQER
jgi:hypothetical protein